MIGMLGEGGGAEDDEEDDDEDDESAEEAGGDGYSMAEVAKHTTKGDCWVVVAGQVLNVTNFLSQHPGGELAILTFAGKDATEEFNMIHPPDVIGKYAPDAVIGKIGVGGPKKEKKAKKGAAAPAAAVAHKGADWSKKEANKKKRMDGVGKIHGWLGAFCYMVR